MIYNFQGKEMFFMFKYVALAIVVKREVGTE